MTGNKSNRKINENVVFDQDELEELKNQEKILFYNKYSSRGGFHISVLEILKSKILGEGSYQILNNPENFEEGNYQASPENLNNPEVAKESFHTSLLNSISVDRKEVNNF